MEPALTWGHSRKGNVLSTGVAPVKTSFADKVEGA